MGINEIAGRSLIDSAVKVYKVNKCFYMDLMTADVRFAIFGLFPEKGGI